jgi:hypothetical protein
VPAAFRGGTARGGTAAGTAPAPVGGLSAGKAGLGAATAGGVARGAAAGAALPRAPGCGGATRAGSGLGGARGGVTEGTAPTLPAELAGAADGGVARGGTTRPGATSSPFSAGPSGRVSVGSSCSATSTLEEAAAAGVLAPSALFSEACSAAAGWGGVLGRAAGAADVPESEPVVCPSMPVPDTGERPSAKITSAAAEHTSSPATRCGR